MAVSQVKLKFFELVFRRTPVGVIWFVIVNVVLFSLQNDSVFVHVNLLLRGQALLVDNIASRSVLQNFLDHFFIDPKVILIVNISTKGNMQH